MASLACAEGSHVGGKTIVFVAANRMRLCEIPFVNFVCVRILNTHGVRLDRARGAPIGAAGLRVPFTALGPWTCASR